jgi:thiamine biosynthesis lipoprotein
MKLFRLFSLIFLTMSLFSSCKEDLGYVNISGYAQGGTYLVTANITKDVELDPEQIKTGIDEIILNIDNTLSGYNKGSMLSKFNAGETIVPNEMFVDIYQRSREFWRLTDGAVDVAAGPLFDAWGFGFKSGDMPTASQVSDLLDGTGMDRLVEQMSEAVSGDGSLCGADLLMDENSGGALPLLNYNAVAQGYSCDLVAAYLYSLGIKDMLVNIGGEIFVDGLNPRGSNWTLGIDRPEDGNMVPGQSVELTFKTDGGPCGIVTSGNYRKFYIKDGKKYAHTVDPRTGYPVDHHLLCATIISPDATSADAFATHCMVVGLEKAKEFILNTEGLDGYLIYEENGKMMIWSSREMPGL